MGVITIWESGASGTSCQCLFMHEDVGRFLFCVHLLAVIMQLLSGKPSAASATFWSFPWRFPEIMEEGRSYDFAWGSTATP
jgi:hypothetical protein